MYRLMERVIVIKVNERKNEKPLTRDLTQWSKRFAVLINQASCTVGEIIRIGQWLHSVEGQRFYGECLTIIHEELGNSSRISRIAQSAACVLFSARKVRFIKYEIYNYSKLKYTKKLYKRKV